MSYKITITESAKMDLNEIGSYIAEDNSIEVALNIIDSIYVCIKNLESFPNIGTLPKSRTAQKKGYKVLITNGYNIYYKAYEGNNIIIHRVRNAKISLKNQI